MSLIVFVPANPDGEAGWLRVADGAIVERGSHLDPTGEVERALLVVPAAAVTLHRATLPDLPARQAAAAGRLIALENVAAPADTLHVAAGPVAADGSLDLAVVNMATMAGWLGWAEARGLDGGPVVPAALFLPRPDDGYATGTVGGERIARGGSSAFVIDETLAPLLLADAPVEEVPADVVTAALVAALATPPLDLRQGIFARRRKFAFDWALARRAAVLVGLILLASVAISLAIIARYNASTARLDAAALAAARTVVPEVASVEQAETALDARAAAAGVGGRGFTAGAARLLAALDQSPNAALTAFETTADGAIRATVAGPVANDVDIALAALRASGASVEAAPAQTVDGRQSVTLTLAPR